MPFITQSKTNWKSLLIIIILVVIVGGGILGYQWWIEKQETKIPELKISEKVDIKKYLHKDAILRGVEMPPEAEYKAISLEEAIRFAIQHLKNRGVKEIKICETSWFVAPFGGFIIDGEGDFSIGEKTYSTFRIGVFDGSWPEKQKAGEEFLFIARGEDDKGNIIWYPEPGPDFQPTEGEPFPEELMAYEFLSDREKFESLSSRFIEKDETADWKTYRNEKYGYEVKYPQYCSLQETSSGHIYINGNCDFRIGVVDNLENLSLNEWLDRKRENETNIVGADVIFRTPSSISGAEESIKGLSGCCSNYGKEIILLKNGKIYSMWTIKNIFFEKEERKLWLEGKIEESNDIFNQILSTFKFLE